MAQWCYSYSYDLLYLAIHHSSQRRKTFKASEDAQFLILPSEDWEGI